MKLELQEFSLATLQGELEEARTLQEQEEARGKRLAQVHSKAISEVTATNEDLKATVGKLTVSYLRLCMHGWFAGLVCGYTACMEGTAPCRADVCQCVPLNNARLPPFHIVRE